jgi:hypothetical protein
MAKAGLFLGIIARQQLAQTLDTIERFVNLAATALGLLTISSFDPGLSNLAKLPRPVANLFVIRPF